MSYVEFEQSQLKQLERQIGKQAKFDPFQNEKPAEIAFNTDTEKHSDLEL